MPLLFLFSLFSIEFSNLSTNFILTVVCNENSFILTKNVTIIIGLLHFDDYINSDGLINHILFCFKKIYQRIINKKQVKLIKLDFYLKLFHQT